eukprot:TRINITY_DN53157_c0_g1_i1.p2 TRINITY_DN53157_c0_g1~~TRINITY_DN53157_c0_g1_i1.p2  ORF type:complete len:132 (-),score=26.73 TRINITY_DN53157_c0_g1_i1:483-878(-)
MANVAAQVQLAHRNEMKNGKKTEANSPAVDTHGHTPLVEYMNRHKKKTQGTPNSKIPPQPDLKSKIIAELQTQHQEIQWQELQGKLSVSLSGEPAQQLFEEMWQVLSELLQEGVVEMEIGDEVDNPSIMLS